MKLHPKLWESVFLHGIDSNVSASMHLEHLEPKYTRVSKVLHQLEGGAMAHE